MKTFVFSPFKARIDPACRSDQNRTYATLLDTQCGGVLAHFCTLLGPVSYWSASLAQSRARAHSGARDFADQALTRLLLYNVHANARGGEPRDEAITDLPPGNSIRDSAAIARSLTQSSCFPL